MALLKWKKFLWIWDTGLALPVGSMNTKESVHSGLNTLLSLFTFLFFFVDSLVRVSPFLGLTRPCLSRSFRYMLRYVSGKTELSLSYAAIGLGCWGISHGALSPLSPSSVMLKKTVYVAARNPILTYVYKTK